MARLPKATYRLNVIPTEIPMTFCIELTQMNLKFIQNHKKPYIVKAILPDFGLYYKAPVIEIYQHWHKTRHTEQWDRTEPRNKPAQPQSTHLQQRRPKYTMEKTQFLR